MLRRLVEAQYTEHVDAPRPEQVLFWLKEARTPSILMDRAGRFPEPLLDAEPHRPLLKHARFQNIESLATALEEEEREERQRDLEYWKPLVAELKRLRHGQGRI